MAIQEVKQFLLVKVNEAAVDVDDGTTRRKGLQSQAEPTPTAGFHHDILVEVFRNDIISGIALELKGLNGPDVSPVDHHVVSPDDVENLQITLGHHQCRMIADDALDIATHEAKDHKQKKDIADPNKNDDCILKRAPVSQAAANHPATQLKSAPRIAQSDQNHQGHPQRKLPLLIKQFHHLAQFKPCKGTDLYWITQHFAYKDADSYHFMQQIQNTFCIFAPRATV